MKNEQSSNQSLRGNNSDKLNQPAEFKCLVFGWHPRFKGLDVAFRAADILYRRGLNLSLCIMGGMSEENQRFIESRTGLSAYSSFIRYLPGAEDMFAVYREMDVFLSSSRVEAFSYALLEAISQNIPIVVSDIQATRWSAEYNKSFYYPVEEAEKCADAIQQAVRVRNAPSNASEIIEKYSIEKWSDRMLEVFEKGIKRHFRDNDSCPAEADPIERI